MILTVQLSKAAAARMHYLGASNRCSLEYADEFGWITFSNPTSRRLPQDWLELNRWILLGKKNGGSQQWARAVKWLRETAPKVTTVVSYSDPAQGHTGALYRDCNFIEAATWLRLVTPPSGNGFRGGKQHGAKDRWIFPLAPDPRRATHLKLPESYKRRFPGRFYQEPKRRWKRDPR
jgi:hypothetical protein